MFKLFKEPKSPEVEKQIETKVILEFMRHGEKDPNKTEPVKPDNEVRLTEKGRKMAQEKGEKLNPQKEVALGWGSPKVRTHETALHAILPEIDANASLEEMEEMIKKEQKIGKKLISDERLSFDFSKSSGAETIKEFKAGRYLPHLIEKSDQNAIDAGDKTSSTYSRFAGNVSEIIDRYAKVGDNFNRIASKNDKYQEFGNQLERYLGTHLGVAECFTAKVLEKIEGNAKRDEFIKSVGEGFKETEGIHLEIINNGNEQKIKITYPMNGSKENIEIDKSLIEEIIKERDEFEKLIDKNVAEKEAVEV